MQFVNEPVKLGRAAALDFEVRRVVEHRLPAKSIDSPVVLISDSIPSWGLGNRGGQRTSLTKSEQNVTIALTRKRFFLSTRKAKRPRRPPPVIRSLLVAQISRATVDAMRGNVESFVQHNKMSGRRSTANFAEQTS
jgi:hypothetical protein